MSKSPRRQPCEPPSFGIMPSGERIVSTTTGDVLGSRWGRSTPASLESLRPVPPRARASPHQTPETNGIDIIGSRRAPSPQKKSPDAEPIISTIDEGDIIGRKAHWVPRIDRLDSQSPGRLLRSRHAAPASSSPTRTNGLPAGNNAAATTTTSSGGGGPPSSDLTKLKRLIDRLSWKSHTLLFTQHVALTSPAASTTPAAAPTTMFKLDFFEYYTLLERILVLLLAHFRVPVPKSTISGNGGSDGKDGGRFGGWAHRYHESVLEAVAKEGTPVSAVLGREEVLAALRRAKAFRNRWKDADEHAVAAWECQREDVLELRLEELVEVVLAALEAVYRVAEAAAAGGGLSGDGGEGQGVVVDGQGQRTWEEVGHAHVDEDMEDAPWEAVGDAMEDVMDMDVE